MPLASIDAENLLLAIQNRRSVKLACLKPDPVDPELVSKVLEAANWAPSHGQTEPWRFTVFTGESRRGLGEVFASTYREVTEANGTFKQEAFESQRDRVWLAPVWISIGMSPGIKPDGKRAMPEEEEAQAVACAVQNLHLMACALGLGGQWTSNNIATHPKVARFVGLEAPCRCLGFFFLGHPSTEWPTGKRKPVGEKVKWA